MIPRWAVLDYKQEKLLLASLQEKGVSLKALKAMSRIKGSLLENTAGLSRAWSRDFCSSPTCVHRAQTRLSWVYIKASVLRVQRPEHLVVPRERRLASSPEEKGTEVHRPSPLQMPPTLGQHLTFVRYPLCSLWTGKTWWFSVMITAMWLLLEAFAVHLSGKAVWFQGKRTVCWQGGPARHSRLCVRVAHLWHQDSGTCFSVLETCCLG